MTLTVSVDGADGGTQTVVLTPTSSNTPVPFVKDKQYLVIVRSLDGKDIDYLPAAPGLQARVEPVYETIPGWKGTTGAARSWADLPAQAVKYVRRIEELVEAPVTLLSTSPERDDTISVRDPFEG